MTAEAKIRGPRQIALISLGALALLVGLRLIPSAPAISHMDFLVLGPGSLQFCDAANPKFLSVVTSRQPATLAVSSATSPEVGTPVGVTVILTTATGKPIGPVDLLETDGQKMNLYLIDESLADCRHVVPLAGEKSGEWRFAFTPRTAGSYRVFADFTPQATGRELYASAELGVGPIGQSSPPPAWPGDSWTAEHGDTRFTLRPSSTPIVARQPVELQLDATPSAGNAPPLLAIFDQDRNGFVNLRPDSASEAPTFKVTIPDPGHYILWSRVKLNGREVPARFYFTVVP